jgi:hypothetical protein
MTAAYKINEAIAGQGQLMAKGGGTLFDEWMDGPLHGRTSTSCASAF